MAHEHHIMSIINLIYNSFIVIINLITISLNKNFIKALFIFYNTHSLHLHEWS